MRCASCDAKLPTGHRLDDDICPVCAHEVRKALGIGDFIDQLPELDYSRGEYGEEEKSEEP